MPIIAAIQMRSNHEVESNLAVAGELIAKAVTAGAQLIVLPENFAIMGLQPQDHLEVRESFGQGPIQDFLSEQAKRHGVWIVGGTIPIATDLINKVRASCLVINSEGNCMARYDKIHLFDVTLPNQETYQESAIIESGTQVVLVDTPLGKLGLSVCYDIRFPELFRRLFQQGAEIITIPAAFTVKTGEAHWELLARSRAVENFCYVVGAAQEGTHSNSRKTYGHSLIIEPWGAVVASISRGVGYITAEVDLNHLHELRRTMPIGEHRRL